jgi:hypothetical protein
MWPKDEHQGLTLAVTELSAIGDRGDSAAG